MKTKTLKYIIVKADMGREAAIVFDERVVHICTYVEQDKIVSAGFCRLIFDERFDKGLIIEVWGESTSLKLKSRELDKNLIYQSMIAGIYDYHMEPDDPLADHIQELIDAEVNKR